MRALVIDDSRAMRSMIRRHLAQLGYEVVEAGDGREALSQIEEHWPVDVALVDWNLPELNGLGFVKAVRTDTRYDSLALLMVTTELGGDQVIAAIKAGVDDYLMKPFTLEALREKLLILKESRG